MMNNTSSWVLYLSLSILFAFAFLFFAFWYGWRLSRRAQGTSPYTGLPLRRGTDLSYYSIERLARFLNQFHQYDNRMFNLSKSAFCRDTGRMFQNCVTFLGIVKLDWTFLQKRYPGSYVSWGSLSIEQQQFIRKAHESLEGFQTEYSSPTPAPRAIESEYTCTKPGPLYVDINSKVLLGWQVVPETDLEVLIVQKPVK